MNTTECLTLTFRFKLSTLYSKHLLHVVPPPPPPITARHSPKLPSEAIPESCLNIFVYHHLTLQGLLARALAHSCEPAHQPTACATLQTKAGPKKAQAQLVLLLVGSLSLRGGMLLVLHSVLSITRATWLRHLL